MKEDKKWYDRLSEEERRIEIARDCKTLMYCIAIVLIIFTSAMLFSCSDDNDPTIKTPNTHYWQTRHDAIPETFKGEWVSVSDKTEIVLNVTDRFVMTKDFTLSPEQGNAVKIDDRQYRIYQNGHVYTLAFGINQYAGQVQISVDNDCYDTVVPFEPELPQPEPQEPVFNVN